MLGYTECRKFLEELGSCWLEDSVLLRYDAISLGYQFLMFWRKIVPSCSNI